MGLATDRRTVAAVHAMAVGLAVLNLAATRRRRGAKSLRYGRGTATARQAAGARAIRGAKRERKS